MSLPKEPRQKMINMMYLVLTALLALNVSAEILNAFKTVNNSLIKTNDVFESKDKMSHQTFEDFIKNPQTAQKALLWKPKADSADVISNDMYDYLEKLKLKIEQAAGLKKNEKGEEEFNYGDLEAGTRIMIKEKSGDELLNKLIKFRTDMLTIIPERKDEFDKEIPLDLSIPKSESGEKRDWSTAYFHMTPAIAAVTILSKFQNDVKTSEALISDYCLSQISSVKVITDQFVTLAQANKSYVMVGDNLEIRAGVGAFSSQAKPQISFGGAGGTQKTNPDGTTTYSINVNGTPGDKIVNVNFRYVDPNTAKELTKTEIVKYTVGIPSNAVYYLKKMNVMYVGVDNPISIVGSSGSEKVKAEFPTGLVNRLTPTGTDWVIKPNQSGEQTLTVIDGGKRIPFKIRCRMLPDPKPMVGSYTGNVAVPTNVFKAQKYLTAALGPEENFDARFRVQSYEVAVWGPNVSAKYGVNLGSPWTGDAAAAINAAQPGSHVVFTNIVATGVDDGSTRQLGSVSFLLK